MLSARYPVPFQSPRGDFGFLKIFVNSGREPMHVSQFQSPRGDFGFLKTQIYNKVPKAQRIAVSIPSRGFWFFEAVRHARHTTRRRVATFQSPRGDFGFLKPLFFATPSLWLASVGFNPLAGILVF